MTNGGFALSVLNDRCLARWERETRRLETIWQTILDCFHPVAPACN